MPSAERQGERLGPQFSTLTDAIANQRLTAADLADEVDPELVLVFDLAGTVAQFCNAVKHVEGLEFLVEQIEPDAPSDDDFHAVDGGDILHSIQVVFTNARAAQEMVSLFDRWSKDSKVKLADGLAKFKAVFQQLRAVRFWGVQDRIRETGLLAAWQETLEVVGSSASSVMVEIELWYRDNQERQRQAERRLRELIARVSGRVKSQCLIETIRYHALLVELPIQQVQTVLEQGAEQLEILAARDVMYVSPFRAMAVRTPVSDSDTFSPRSAQKPDPHLKPQVALLDGLPFANHTLLQGRLLIDDPDDTSANYPVDKRLHGTAMASLIIHGDLSREEVPLASPVYCRPILQPGFFDEEVRSDRLFPDLLHRAVRRMFDGEAGAPPSAPGVRVINLSVGDDVRALVRRVSPAGRLLDWLTAEYNVLFIVSAGNHDEPPTISWSDWESGEHKAAVARWRRSNARSRGILPPGDAITALTVGAAHADGSVLGPIPDTVVELVDDGMPALYSARGTGLRRSVKPELHHDGGRSLHVRPVREGDAKTVDFEAAPHASGPGLRVAAAAAGRPGGVAFTRGTSGAAALVTREASRLLDVLRDGPAVKGDPAFPDSRFHPLLVRALLVHASGWGDMSDELAEYLQLSGQERRRVLTTLLGYGRLDPTRAGSASPSRATLIAGGEISRDELHRYEVPYPTSLRAKVVQHRVTVTLAYVPPVAAHLSRYRATKVGIRKLDERVVGGTRSEADHHAVQAGALQHEVYEGTRALAFTPGDTFSVEIEALADARNELKKNKVRYGLVISIETTEDVSVTIHDEVRAALQAQVRLRSVPATRQRLRER